MSTTQHQEAFRARLAEMGDAVNAKDLDALLDYYDDALVFIEGTNVMDKAGLADYMRKMWAEQPEFTADVAASCAFDDVLAVTLDASVGIGEAKVHWPIFALYTFDLTTMKVVRELAFSDEDALAQKFAALGVA